MKIKCSHCNGTVEITIDRLIFESEDEEAFVTFLSLEMSKSHFSERDCTPKEKRKQ